MQDTNTTAALQLCASLHEERSARSLQMAMGVAHPRAALATTAAQPRGLMRKIIALLAAFLSGRLFRSAAKRTPLPQIIPSAEAPAPVVFKANGSISTFVTPVGVYAGKPAAQDLRKVALQRFHRIESSRGETIN